MSFIRRLNCCCRLLALGSIEVGQSLLWGPTADGGFSPVSVSCIQRSHVPVRQVQPGQTATLALQPVGADGLPLGSSKEALLSAAAAAQAAAEEQAAREAAAACAAAPTIAFGKPYSSAVAIGSGIAHPEGGAVLCAAASTTSSNSSGSYCCVAADGSNSANAIDDSRLNMLVDHLAEGLTLSDDEGENSTTPGDQSEADSLTGFFDHDAAHGEHPISHLGRHQEPQLQRHSTDESRTNETSNSVSGRSVGHQNGTRPAPDNNEALQARPHGGTSAPLPIGRGFTRPQCSVNGNTHTQLTGRGSLSASSSVATSTASLDSMRYSSPLHRAVYAIGAPCSSSNKFMPAAEAATPAAGVATLGCSPPTSRSKGTVLLDASAAPCTYWEFGALLVLLGGHWPARGLLSGCWPPKEATAVHSGHSFDLEGSPVVAVGQQLHEAAPAAERRQHKKHRAKRHDYAYVIHCNSIRQVARIVHMQEVREPAVCQQQEWQRSAQTTSDSDHSAVAEDFPPVHCTQSAHAGLSASIRAAATLLQGQWLCDSHSCSADGGSSSGGGRASNSGLLDKHLLNMGSVVSVRFGYSHRPEWMQMGARLIVRDRSDGHVAAAGFVTQLLKPHKQH